MSEENFKSIAGQLRKPEGTLGKEIGGRMNEGNLLMNKEVIDELDVTTNDNILEIGMGNGFFVKYILSKDQTVQYTGCDYSEIMVNEAGILNERFIKNKQARFQASNAMQLPFDGEYFDKVFTINTVYFWDDVKKVLSEIARVLKKNGLFIVAIRPKSVMDNLPVTKYGFNTFSKTDLEDLLAKNGFIVNSIIDKEDVDLEFNNEKIKNSVLIVKANKL